MEDQNHNSRVTDMIASNALTFIVSLLVAGVLGVFGVVIMTYRHDNALDSLNKSVQTLKQDVEVLKMSSTSFDVKISSHDESIRRHADAIDSIRYKLATIPDRNELNESFNLFYERLSNKIDKK